MKKKKKEGSVWNANDPHSSIHDRVHGVRGNKLKSKSKTSSSSSSSALRDRLNVLIIGLDGQSRLNFIRQMSKTVDYVVNNLSAISLEGYTKVV